MLLIFLSMASVNGIGGDSEKFVNLWINVTTGTCENMLSQRLCEQVASAKAILFSTESNPQWPQGCYLYEHDGRKELYFNDFDSGAFQLNNKNCGSHQVGACFCPRNNFGQDCSTHCNDGGEGLCDWCGFSNDAPMICCHDGTGGKPSLKCQDAIFDSTVGSNGTTITKSTNSGYQCVVQPGWTPPPEVVAPIFPNCKRDKCVVDGLPQSACCGEISKSSCSQGYEYSPIDDPECMRLGSEYRGICCRDSGEREVIKEEIISNITNCVNDDRVADRNYKTCSMHYDDHPEDCGEYDWANDLATFIAAFRCCACRDNVITFNHGNNGESMQELGLGIGVSILCLFMFAIIYQTHRSMKMKMEIDSEVKKRQSMQVKDLRKSILDLEKMEIEGSPDTDKEIDIKDPAARKRSTSASVDSVQPEVYKRRPTVVNMSMMNPSSSLPRGPGVSRQPSLEGSVQNTVPAAPERSISNSIEIPADKPNITQTVMNLKTTYEMYKIGALTDDEFQTVKDKILLYE